MKTPNRVGIGVLALVLGVTGFMAGTVGTGHTDAAHSAATGADTSAEIPATLGAVPHGFGTWAELFAVQQKLNSAAGRIVAERGSGYAGIVAAPENRELRVYWKGTVPASVQQVAGTVDVPVRFMPARFTEREMLAEAKRLTAEPAIRSVGPEVDGSGLSISLTSAGQAALRSGSGLLRKARMPLYVRSGPTPNLLDHRQGDEWPYWGGSYYAMALPPDPRPPRRDQEEATSRW